MLKVISCPRSRGTEEALSKSQRGKIAVVGNRAEKGMEMSYDKES